MRKGLYIILNSEATMKEKGLHTCMSLIRLMFGLEDSGD